VERVSFDGRALRRRGALQAGSGREYRRFLSRAVAYRDRRGKILKWYGTSSDIEDRKRAEEEREKLRSDLAH
jgi:PAS domain-containing protein